MSEKPTTESGVPVIEMRGVGIGGMKDPSLVVATDVNWTVKPGEFWVVAGAQRSGKTDFLMTAGGLVPPTSGNYRFQGTEMPIFDEEQIARRLKLGVVFDSGQLFHHMTVAENISLPLLYHRELFDDDVQARTAELLEATGLTGMADNTPANIGRGLQKRAGLARALAVRPEAVLLDNPLSGVDVSHAYWWLEFLEGLARGHALMGGKPVTVVTTTDSLRPWRAEGRFFACLANERLTVLGDWSGVERSNETAVKNLLRDQNTRPIEKPEERLE